MCPITQVINIFGVDRLPLLIVRSFVTQRIKDGLAGHSVLQIIHYQGLRRVAVTITFIVSAPVGVSGLNLEN